MPTPLAYFSPVVGGLPGAARLGMEPTYYWDALDSDALAWLRANTGPGRTIQFATFPTSWLYLREIGALPHRLAPLDRGTPAWYVLQNRPGAWAPWDRALVSRATPSYTVTKLGVPLVWIFPYGALSGDCHESLAVHGLKKGLAIRGELKKARRAGSESSLSTRPHRSGADRIEGLLSSAPKPGGRRKPEPRSRRPRRKEPEPGAGGLLVAEAAELLALQGVLEGEAVLLGRGRRSGPGRRPGPGRKTTGAGAQTGAGAAQATFFLWHAWRCRPEGTSRPAPRKPGSSGAASCVNSPED